MDTILPQIIAEVAVCVECGGTVAQFNPKRGKPRCRECWTQKRRAYEKTFAEKLKAERPPTQQKSLPWEAAGFGGLSCSQIAKQLKFSKQRASNLWLRGQDRIVSEFRADPEFAVALGLDVRLPETELPTHRYVSFGGHYMTPAQRRMLAALSQLVSVLKEEGAVEEAVEVEKEIADLQRRVAGIVTEESADPVLLPVDDDEKLCEDSDHVDDDGDDSTEAVCAETDREGALHPVPGRPEELALQDPLRQVCGGGPGEGAFPTAGQDGQ